MKNFIICTFHIYDRIITSRKVKWEWCIGRKGQMKTEYKIFTGKPESKRGVRRPRCRCEDNIRTDLKEIGSEGLN